MATTEQLMTLYGVEWYDFDEGGGNTTGKLGSIGTVTGTNRVAGWNGEGYAMNFNGTSDVMTQTLGFDAQIPSSGGVTIRFKFKCNTVKASDMYMLATLNAYATQKGMSIGIILNGKFHIAWTNAGAKYCFQYVSDKVYADDKWHDVFVSWDGLANSLVRIYIDDMNTPVAVLIAQFDNVGHLYPNFNLGRSAGATTGWYTGQIDDVQIYSKALLPSDFNQKRIVIKTTDSKNLVLSPSSGRVKQIPSSVEYMVLAQGYAVKEIDSAVDSTPIDFTKPTTEYEIVSNNKVPLGKGRMFTVPIGADFKTTMIEDNY